MNNVNFVNVNNVNLKCECCQIYITKDEEYRDGNLIYCLQCVQSKKMDDNLHEMYHVEWNYCEHCRNLVMEEDFVGNCHIQIKCKQSIKNKIKNNNEYYSRGYTHLCRNCCTVVPIKNDVINKCILE